MTKSIELSGTSGERAMKFAITPKTQSIESVEQSATSGENIGSKSVSGMMTKSIEPSATSEENTIMWDKACFKPVSEYAGFGGPDKVQMDDNGMFYNYYLIFFFL